jgi:hypothetical protein
MRQTLGTQRLSRAAAWLAIGLLGVAMCMPGLAEAHRTDRGWQPRSDAASGAHHLERLALRRDKVISYAMPGELTPAQLLAKYRQYNPTVDGPGSSVLGRLLRDYARYNPTVDAVPALTASATTRQWCASPRHIGFMGLRFVSCASTMGYGNSRADN